MKGKAEEYWFERMTARSNCFWLNYNQGFLFERGKCENKTIYKPFSDGGMGFTPRAHTAASTGTSVEGHWDCWNR